MRMEGELGPEAAAGAYEALVREHLGNDPRFDLVLLGMGPDVHVASLFPGKPELEETRRLVVGVPLAGMEPQVPRVTLTLPVLNRARVVDFLVAGEDKAQAVARAFGDPPDPDAPAARVRPEDGSIFVFVDEAAAALLVKGQFIGLDVGGTKIASATLQDGKLTTRELIKTNVADSDALVGPAGRADRPPALRRHRRGRGRAALDHRVRDRPDRPQRQHPAPGPAAARAADRAGRDPGLHRERRVVRGARGGVRRGRQPRVPEPRDDHRRHRHRRRHGVQRAPLPRRDERRRDRPHGDRARPRGRRAGPRGQAPAAGHARVPRRGPGARPPRRARGASRRRTPSSASAWQEDGEVTGHDVVDGAKAGDADALRVLDILGQRLGIGIANAINLFDPQEIVIGGGVSIAGDLLLEPARTRRRALHGAGAGPAHDDPARAPRRPGRRARRGDGRRAGGGEGASRWRGPASTPTATSRSPSTASSATSTRSRSSAPTARSTGTAARPSTRRACSARSSTRTRAASTRCARRADEWTSKQLYFPDTNVLITRFLTEEGVGEVQDFMPIDHAEMELHRHRLIRRVVVVRGQMGFQIEVQPRFDYARAEHEVEMHPHGVLFRSPDLTLALEGAIARTMGHDRTARAPRQRRLRDLRPRRGRLADVRARARPAGPHLPPLLRARDRPPRSTPPSPTGAAGSGSRATRAAGARWCCAPR